MNSESIIVLAIPIFIIFLVSEMILTDRNGVKAYDLGDTISNLICGMGSQLFGIFFLMIQVYFYDLLLQYKIMDWDHHLTLAWILTFILFDFQYYWFHRVSHKVNIFWCFHVVHHQSERYNFSVALRQSWFGGVISWIFYCPLALLGFPLYIFLSCQALNLVYQFFIHTEQVGKIGPLEKILNTPSHHRVHHGIDSDYIDKNYGGVFIVWDHLFGSFQTETTRAQYGVLKPAMTWSAFKANTSPLFELISQIGKSRHFKEKWGYITKNPGWNPGDPDENSALMRANSTKRPKLGAFTVGTTEAGASIVCTIVLISLTTYLLQSRLEIALYSIFILFILGSFYGLGLWLDRKVSLDEDSSSSTE